MIIMYEVDPASHEAFFRRRRIAMSDYLCFYHLASGRLVIK
jgi:hypothetical protein